MSAAGGNRARLPYWPGLDGLRAVAVVAVLAYHHGFPWAQGGFLGVSLFFTLSGFLITGLVVAEHRDTGNVDLLAFWGRRLRRLAPAALLGVLLAAVVTVVAVPSAQRLESVGTAGGTGLRRELALRRAGDPLRRPAPGSVARSALLVARNRRAVLPCVPAACGRDATALVDGYRAIATSALSAVAVRPITWSA